MASRPLAAPTRPRTDPVLISNARLKKRAETTHPHQALAGNRPLNHVHGALVDTGFGSLQPDLDQVERMADDDGADTADTAGGERLDLFLELLFGHCAMGRRGAGGRGVVRKIGVGRNWWMC